MNLPLDRGATASTATKTVDHLVKELVDRKSLWYDLRVAEMSGYDYVFAPDAACRQFGDLDSLQTFLRNIQTILASGPGRLMLLSYWHDRYRQLHFERYNLSWSGNTATECRKELLDQSPQQDFIRTLFEYSERFIV